MVEEMKMKYANINLTGRKYKLRKKNKITGIIIDILSVTFVIVGIILLVSSVHKVSINKENIKDYEIKIASEKSVLEKLKLEKSTVESEYKSIEIDEKRFEKLKLIGTKINGKPVSEILNKIEKKFENRDMAITEFKYNYNKARLTIDYENTENVMAFVSELQKEFGDASVIENREKTIIIEIEIEKK